MVILKNVYVFRSNPKTNYRLATTDASLVMTVKMFILICNNCDFFYIGETEELKQRTKKHKLDVIHHNNGNCKKCSQHLRT